MQAGFVHKRGGFDMIIDERVVMSHRAFSPALIASKGNADIKMYRGNFDIIDKKNPLVKLDIGSVANNLVSFRAGDDGAAAIMRLTVETGRVLLKIETKLTGCNRLSIFLNAVPGEHVWGGGEQMSYLNLKGRRFPMWTSEPGVGRDKSRELTQIMDKEGMAGGDYWTTNYPQPTFLSSQLYACHLDCSAYSVLDFSDDERHQIEVWQDAATLEFFTAGGYPQLVSKMSERFGKQQPLPEWAIKGAIIGLKDGERSFDRLDKIRESGVIVSGLWCEDWVGIRQTSFGRRLFWNWDWNPQRHPGLPDKVAKLSKNGIRFLGYVNPYLAVDGDQFVAAKAAGYLALQLKVDEPYIVDFGEFDCGIVDFTNPKACDWFAEHIIGREMLDFGLSGWMADFGEYLPIDLRLHDGSDPMQAHNFWPVLWAKVNADAIERRGKSGKAVFFMRAGFSGVQQYCPLLWAGDQCVDFSRHDGIGTVITAALSAGLLGNAYSHSDIGGYTSLHGVVRTDALFKRWTELAAFTPVMRTHEGNRPDDNLQVDTSSDLLAHFAAMTRVHHALSPYVQALMNEAVKTGLPLQRPLFLHYPSDMHCLSCQDQYFYGEDLLVAPIIEQDAMQREVYLPGDQPWEHIWTGEVLAPGSHVVVSPFGSPPVFARAKSEFGTLFRSLKDARGVMSV